MRGFSSRFLDNQLENPCTGDFKSIVQNRDENPRMRKIFNSKSPPKVRACADSRRDFRTTDLKSTVAQEVTSRFRLHLRYVTSDFTTSLQTSPTSLQTSPYVTSDFTSDFHATSLHTYSLLPFSSLQTSPRLPRFPSSWLVQASDFYLTQHHCFRLQGVLHLN